jgi:hypothetical protein
MSGARLKVNTFYVEIIIKFKSSSLGTCGGSGQSFIISLPRISNKYGSLTRNNSLWKVSLLWNDMTYIQNTHRFRGFKLTFADWLNSIWWKDWRMKLMSDFKKHFWPIIRWPGFEAPPFRTYVIDWVIVTCWLVKIQFDGLTYEIDVWF